MRVKRLVFPLCAFWLFTFSMFGADPTGTIAGTVLDPSGAAVVGAKITVTALATGLNRTTASTADAGYVFPLLPLALSTSSPAAHHSPPSTQTGIQPQPP